MGECRARSRKSEEEYRDSCSREGILDEVRQGNICVRSERRCDCAVSLRLEVLTAR
jgi:hypothetical protein